MKQNLSYLHQTSYLNLDVEKLCTMRGADSDLAEPFAMRDWEKTNSPQEKN